MKEVHAGMQFILKLYVVGTKVFMLEQQAQSVSLSSNAVPAQSHKSQLLYTGRGPTWVDAGNDVLLVLRLQKSN